MSELIKCKECGCTHSASMDCTTRSIMRPIKFAESAKAALGRIRALEVKVQSYEAQRTNQIQP